ncbi:hypothetical protein Ccrd_001652, partial [Cynara cardunculus var. scolymus]
MPLESFLYTLSFYGRVTSEGCCLSLNLNHRNRNYNIGYLCHFTKNIIYCNKQKNKMRRRTVQKRVNFT